jgi:predicted TIM-barrel fold metal-dependent hydrolase
MNGPGPEPAKLGARLNVLGAMKMRCDALDCSRVRSITDDGRCGSRSRRFFLKVLGAAGACSILRMPPGWAQGEASAPPAAPHRIDVHHHFFPQFLLDAWQKAGVRNPSAVQNWKIDATLDQMDRGGVATAILSLPAGLNLPDLNPDQSRRLTRLVNEYVVEKMKDHPGRFGLFALLPMPDIDNGLKEIEYALDVLKADGIGLNTSYGAKWLGDPDFKPVMDELNRRKAIVYVHPLFAPCCSGLTPLVPPSFAELPQETNRAVLNLLLSGTFTRTRDVRWVFCHAGGAVPLLAGRIGSLTRLQKTGADALPDGIDFELKRLHYETANAAYAPNMAALLKFVPVSQVLFGSDYPYVPVAENVADLGKLGLPASELKAIERDNAAALIPRLKA